MLFSSKMHIILGLQLVLLINLSQSFVLLTANMEDVKKLAKRFVSESLAEQIADFIAKVTSNGDGTNVSEENEQNEDFFQQISQENGYRHNKVARQRFPNKIEPKYPQRTKPTKSFEINTERYMFPNNVNQNKKYRPSKSRQGIIKQQNYNNWEKKHRLSENQNDLDNNIENVKAEPETKVEYHPDMSVAEADPLQELEVTVKTTKQRRKPRKKQFDQEPVSTMGYAEKYEFDDNPNPSRHKLSQFSGEINEKFDRSQLYESRTESNSATTARFKGFNIERAREELTTKKERNEFDQYENAQNSKAEFIATSGPVALPKMPMKSQSQYWDKAISDIEKSKDDSRKRKAWF